MIGMDRREVMVAAAAATALFSAVPALGGDAATGLFVFDGRFSAAVAEARRRQGIGGAVIDSREIDLGQAWRGPIPRCLDSSARVIAGMTLWMDSLICESFGREHALRISRGAAQMDSGLVAWILR